MKHYHPTNEEVRALFSVLPTMHDCINANERYFYDEDTTDEDRKHIYDSSKAIYKSCLKIVESRDKFPFC